MPRGGCDVLIHNAAKGPGQLFEMSDDEFRPTSHLRSP